MGSRKRAQNWGHHKTLLCKSVPENGPIFGTTFCPFSFFPRPRRPQKGLQKAIPRTRPERNWMRQNKVRQSKTKSDTNRRDTTLTGKATTEKIKNRKDTLTTPYDTSLALACLGPFSAGLALAWVAFACSASLFWFGLLCLALACLGFQWLGLTLPCFILPCFAFLVWLGLACLASACPGWPWLGLACFAVLGIDLIWFGFFCLCSPWLALACLGLPWPALVCFDLLASCFSFIWA